VILSEAGGVFTDWRGRSDIRGGSAIACHADLHAELLATVTARS
jgi:fructose-1,6-bisphosphatase/inositol monophosphatase family enzyme